MLRLAEDLKKEGANRIFMFATYGLFTEGLDKSESCGQGSYFGSSFNKHDIPYARTLAKDWYIQVDMSKYIAYFILALHRNQSITTLLDPHKKIADLLEKYRNGNI